MKRRNIDLAPVGAFTRLRTVAAIATVAAALVQCTSAPPPPPEPSPSPPATRQSPSAPTSTPPPPPPAPQTVHPVTARDLGASWRPGCPVGPEQLRRVDVDYLGFDGQPHRGELIVHADLVAAVEAIFTDLRRLGYPIERMRTVDNYPNADDEASMRDNNTSAFNCRIIPGTERWSQHAYGRAIDLNPLLNPYVGRTGAFQPGNAGPYLDRSRRDPGLLHAGDPAVRVFTDRAWAWGGYWRTVKDYQHFERP
jgi:hypothetical protein